MLHGVIWPAFLAEVVVMLPDVRSKRQWLRAHTIKAAIVVVTRLESRVASLVCSVPGWRPQTVSIGYGAPRSNSPSPRAECPGTESLIGSAIIGIATVVLSSAAATIAFTCVLAGAARSCWRHSGHLDRARSGLNARLPRVKAHEPRCGRAPTAGHRSERQPCRQCRAHARSCPHMSSSGHRAARSTA